MTTTVRVERTRTIQVFGAYTAETCTLMGEQEVIENDDHYQVRAGILADLDRQLDAWERDLRARATKAAAPAMPLERDPDPKKAPQGPAAAMPPTPETRAELRKLASELDRLTGQPVNVPAPKTEADAILLTRQMRASIFDLKQGRKA